MPEMNEPDERSWGEYRRLILAELERIDRGMALLNTKMEVAMDTRDISMTTMKVEIAMLKVKASIWGGLSGTLGAAIAFLLLQLGKH